jgi:hypothetical protein
LLNPLATPFTFSKITSKGKIYWLIWLLFSTGLWYTLQHLSFPFQSSEIQSTNLSWIHCKQWLLLKYSYYRESFETNTSDINTCRDSKVTAVSQEKWRQLCRTHLFFSAIIKKLVNEYFLTAQASNSRQVQIIFVS